MMEPQPSNQAAIKPDAPITRLYRHAIESIFKFCSLKELHVLHAVSRDWSSAVVSMPPIRALQRVGNIETLTAVASSRLGRHVNLVYGRCASTVEGLRILAERMPWIQRLVLEWLVFQDDCAEAALAVSSVRPLKVLSVWLQAPNAAVTIEARDSHAVVANHWIRAAACLPLLEEFSLLLWCHDKRILFAPLAVLPRLHTLSLSEAQLRVPVPSDEHVAALRQMHSLTSFHHHFSDRNGTLRLLLQDPTPPLCWTFAQVASGAADVGPLLAPLAHLTDLHVECHCGDVEFLLSLPHIRVLTIIRYVGSLVSPAALTRIVQTLQRCPQLTSLCLDGLGFTSAQLAMLLPVLPRLSALTLMSLPELTSLGFLATESLSRSLKDLTVCDCRHVPSREVAHLLGLRSLKSLVIDELQQPLSDEQRAQILAAHPRAEL